MKRIKIPLIPQSFCLYSRDEYLRFERVAKKNGYKIGGDEKHGVGCTAGGDVWIKDPGDFATIYHELQHLMDNIFRSIPVTEDEKEFRAYLSEWIYMAATKYYLGLTSELMANLPKAHSRINSSGEAPG